MAVLLSITLFALVAGIFVFANLAVGALVRPWLPNANKRATYECGEVPVGESWVQFDLRFYIVALVYLVFDVEVALFYPWAVAFGANASNRPTALIDMLFFFGVLMVGYAYLWKFGYLDWVKSAVVTATKKTSADSPR